MKYYSFLMATCILIGCNRNTPENAANHYCECLEKEFSILKSKTRADSIFAANKCDSEIVRKYNPLQIYYFDRGGTDEDYQVAKKFHDEYLSKVLQNCCGLIGNCDTSGF